MWEFLSQNLRNKISVTDFFSRIWGMRETNNNSKLEKIETPCYHVLVGNTRTTIVFTLSGIAIAAYQNHRPGNAGMRGSALMVIRPRPYMTRVHEPLLYTGRLGWNRRRKTHPSLRKLDTTRVPERTIVCYGNIST